MIKKSVKKRKTLVIDDVLCNNCGNSLVVERSKVENPARIDDGEEFVIMTGLIDGEVLGGYHSTHLEDGSKYKFSLCEKCLKQMFDSFKIKVEKSDGHYYG